jgi:hypothetical protein
MGLRNQKSYKGPTKGHSDDDDDDDDDDTSLHLLY